MPIPSNMSTKSSIGMFAIISGLMGRSWRGATGKVGISNPPARVWHILGPNNALHFPRGQVTLDIAVAVVVLR